MLELATTADADTIVDMLWAATQWLAARGVSQWSSRYSLEQMHSEIANREVWVRRQDGRVVGSLTLTTRADNYWNDRPERTIYLHRLVIDHALAGQALGRKMLSAAEDLARGQGMAQMRLDCAAVNPVLRSFYQSCGYVFCGEAFYAPYNMSFALFSKAL